MLLMEEITKKYHNIETNIINDISKDSKELGIIFEPRKTETETVHSINKITLDANGILDAVRSHIKPFDNKEPELADAVIYPYHERERYFYIKPFEISRVKEREGCIDSDDALENVIEQIVKLSSEIVWCSPSKGSGTMFLNKQIRYKQYSFDVINLGQVHPNTIMVHTKTDNDVHINLFLSPDKHNCLKPKEISLIKFVNDRVLALIYNYQYGKEHYVILEGIYNSNNRKFKTDFILYTRPSDFSDSLQNMFEVFINSSCIPVEKFGILKLGLRFRGNIEKILKGQKKEYTTFPGDSLNAEDFLKGERAGRVVYYMPYRSTAYPNKEQSLALKYYFRNTDCQTEWSILTFEHIIFGSPFVVSELSLYKDKGSNELNKYHIFVKAKYEIFKEIENFLLYEIPKRILYYHGSLETEEGLIL